MNLVRDSGEAQGEYAAEDGRFVVRHGNHA